MKVVLDTNIIISALFWNGKERRILTMCREKELEMAITMEILEEVDCVLDRKFSVPKDKRGEFIKNLLGISRLVFSGEEIDFLEKDPADNRILECAIAAKASLIITGDKGLLEANGFRKIKIKNSSNFLKLIEKD